MISFLVDRERIKWREGTVGFTDSSMTENREFIYELVKKVEPLRIAELGVFTGVSFFTYCQSVLDNDLLTEIIGVDTWQGDPNAGFYGTHVFNDFLRIKQRYFEDLNIRILHKRFDQALADVEDGSCEIIMIDGRHSYEAVKEDYLSWLPKLAKDGVVLFHDTRVHKGDFGVYKFWEELQEPAVEFLNQYGLGVAFPKGTKHMDFVKHFTDNVDIKEKTVGVYSAIYGGFDQPIAQKKNDTRFHLFTDKAIELEPWEVSVAATDELETRMQAKFWKVLPNHSFLHMYDRLIWVDGNIEVNKELLEFAQTVDQIAFFKHPELNCAYDEVANISKHRKWPSEEDRNRALKQMGKYESEKYPHNYGMHAGTVIIRNMHSEKVNKFNEIWWNEIKAGSMRDQLSLDYSLWKARLKAETIPGDLWNNKFIKRHNHG